MRKETTGRLLLSLLTVFIMVVGALGAALPAFVTQMEESPMRPVVDEAGNELDLRISETGDAPVSADKTNGDNLPLEPTPAFFVDGMDLEATAGEEIREVESEVSSPDTPNGHGTRNPDTVDAGGPYGSVDPFVPVYEGDPITYEATIEPEDELDNYQFRWDVDGDGVFDGPGDVVDEYFGEYGENTFTNTLYDDFYGDVLVQAWDGSWKTVTFEGRLLDGYTENNYYYYGTTYQTFGYTFEVSEEVTATQVGNYRYSSYPYNIYNVRLWDEAHTVIAEVAYPGQTSNTWTWNDITPVTLYPGETYMISAYIYYRYMASCAMANMPAESEDGKIITGNPYRSTGNVYPTSSISEYPMLDFNYEWDEVLPDVLEDTAETFVLNRLPIVTNAVVSPDTTREGSEDAQFTGQMVDLGLDDEWEYQWDFGDGEQSEWLPVPTWEGGIKLLFLHGNHYPAAGWDFYQSFRDPLLDLMGPHVTHWEMYDWSWLGNDAAPDLDYLMEFDVVLVSGFAVGSASGTHGDTGDVLADYVDAGGAVVQMQNTMGYDPGYPTTYGIEGRWRNEEYVTLTTPTTVYQASPFYYLNWWDPTHPIMDGPFGTVSSFGSLLSFNHMGVTTYANLLATYDNGHYAAAYTNEDHHGNPGSGRIVGLNWYAYDQTTNFDYMDGDGFVIVANALMWASQQPLAQKLSQPYTLPPISHIYKDDHPTHITPSDQLQPSVRIRDDDHGAYILLSETIFLEETDWPGSGTYYPGEYSGWTDEHKSIAYYYGWWRQSSSYAGGSPYEARISYSYARSGYHFYTAAFDTSAFPTLSVQFKSYVNHYSGVGLYTLHAGVSYDGSTWTEIWTESPGSSGRYDGDAPFFGGSPTTYIGFWFGGDPWYINYWYLDDVVIKVQETWGPTEGMSDWMPTSNLVTIENVQPSIIVPPELPSTVSENLPITFEGIELYDPAMYEETEQMYYRIDMDDGTPVGPWNFVGKVLPDQYEDFETGTGWPWSPWQLYGPTPFFQSVHPGAAHDGMYGLEIDMGDYHWYYRDDLSIGGVAGEKLNFWLYVPGYGPSMTDSGRAYMGFGADSVGAYEFIIAPNTNQIMIYNDYPYGTFSQLAAAPYTFNYIGWYRCEVEFMSMTEVTCRLFADDGVTLLVELSHNNPGGYNLPGGISFRMFDYGLTATHFYVDSYNAGDLQLDKEIPTFSHNYMDNGIYYLDVQTLDDDMYWDFSGPQPVFVGPPGEDPADWIKHNYIPIEVLNTDPMISPRIRAYSELDLSIRMSGTKTHEATMSLVENGVEIGYCEVTREPGAPNIGVISNVDLEVTKNFEYEVVITVDPQGDGGSNPTWLFDMVFPDGKFKEFKHTFNDEHGWTWTITDSELKGALLGHDIIFEASAEDSGSDDLAFVWNFGDTTPHGIHLFANVNQGTAVEAVSDEATVIFDQLPNRDAAFVRADNDMRTPDGTPIAATDSISHVFDADQAYYYYVSLTVMDDDVCDGYPSTFLNGGGYDMEFVEIDFR